MTTNNKLLRSLFLLTFASKCLVSMPPKINPSAVLLQDGETLGYFETTPVSLDDAIKRINFFINDCIGAKVSMLQRALIIERNCRGKGRNKIVESMERTIKIGISALAELREIKVKMTDVTFRDDCEKGLRLQAIFMTAHSEHNQCCDQYSTEKSIVDEDPHGPDSRGKRRLELRQKALKAAFGQPQISQSATTPQITEDERVRILAELQAEEAETAKTAAKAPSRAPKSKKGK